MTSSRRPTCSALAKPLSQCPASSHARRACLTIQPTRDAFDPRESHPDCCSTAQAKRHSSDSRTSLQETLLTNVFQIPRIHLFGRRRLPTGDLSPDGPSKSKIRSIVEDLGLRASKVRTNQPICSSSYCNADTWTPSLASDGQSSQISETFQCQLHSQNYRRSTRYLL